MAFFISMDGMYVRGGWSRERTSLQKDKLANEQRRLDQEGRDSERNESPPLFFFLRILARHRIHILLALFFALRFSL